MTPFRLSKSRLMDFLQCPKKLYLRTHHPELAEDSADAMQSFQVGHEVGDVAQSLYPDGVLIGHDNNLSLALADTRKALEEHPNTPIFEATFEHQGVLVRVDLLLPYRDGHEMIEVKSSGSVKPQYLPDCAVQSWVLKGAGINLIETTLAHIDTSFVYAGDKNYLGLFKHNSIKDTIAPLVSQVPSWIDTAQSVLSGDTPDIDPGAQCTSPYECQFLNHCAPKRNEGYPVTILPRISRKQADTFKTAGITDVRDIPDGLLTNPAHLQVWRATVSGKPEINPNISAILKKYPYPRFYLDFETIGLAVPRWKGATPFQQIPFQWSCHIERGPGPIEHREFLDTSGADPTWAFIKALLNAVGDSGPIFVYSSFEKTVLKRIIDSHPLLAARIEDMIARLVDLYPITVKNYYHPDMRGSWSIKQVLPTVSPELNYHDVGEVQDGGMAQQAYLTLISGDTPDKRKDALRHDLLEYCKLDTLAMVKLEHFLENAASTLRDYAAGDVMENKHKDKPAPVEHLVVAVSSRALFDLDESHHIFETDGVEAYCRYQIENEDVPLQPGVAFNLVKKLLKLNERDPANPRVEVILLSRNSADTGLRIFNSIKHHDLNISRAAFTRGESTHSYISSFGAHLFLSAEPDDVRKVLDAGFAAATILPSDTTSAGENNSSQLRIAFDGDAVLFSDESERIFKQEGLNAFQDNETKEAKLPLPGGPFKNFLAMLHQIQLDYPGDTSPIRTLLITARGAPAHERVIRTLRAWNIRIDEALFLGGMEKGEFLRAFRADIFFDDQRKHCDSARQHVATGHVPHGVANE
jgi:hypothetical protein